LHKRGVEGDPEGRDLKAAAAQIEEIKAYLRVEEGKLTELRVLDPQTAVRLADLELAGKQLKLDEAKLGLEECDLTAPEDGTVLRVFVGPGDVLGSQPKQPAIVFAPNRPLIVRAELDQEYASRVHKGQLAVVEDEARTGEEWRGVVEHIAGAYMPRRSAGLEPFSLHSDARILECLVVLEPGERLPRICQKVRVKILEQRR
jgi:multidrug resistance efflux pump